MTVRWAERDRYQSQLMVTLAAVAMAGVVAVVGLPPVSIHGPPHRVGVMDPLCGMTRAVQALARGEFAAAWRFNPASFVLAGFAVLMVTRAVIGWSTRRWLEVAALRLRVVRVVALIGVVALWINQQINVARLT